MAKADKQQAADLVTVRPSQATLLIKQCLNAHRPVMLWGPPGIGKSDLIKQIADSYTKPRQVIDIRLILMDPTDLKGIPFFDSNEGRMKWAPSGELPQVVTKKDLEKAQASLNALVDRLEDFNSRQKDAIKNKEVELEATLIKAIRETELAIKTSEVQFKRLEDHFSKQDAIIFLDELVSAPPAVQGAAYQLMLNRRIGEYVLPDGCDIVAAGNRETDRGIVHQMPKPLQNRLVHLELTDSFDDWQKWAINNRVNPDVIGYLSSHTQDLFNFDPKDPSKAFPTPRSWVFVGNLLEDRGGLSLEAMHPLIAGTVGNGVAFKFIQHLKVAANMPNPKEVLLGNETKMKITDLSAKYSLGISMCYMLHDWYQIAKENDDSGKSKKDKTAYGVNEWHSFYDNFLSFMMKNFEPEMIILAARTSLSGEFKLAIDHKKLKNFAEFFDKYGKIVLEA